MITNSVTNYRTSHSDYIDITHNNERVLLKRGVDGWVLMVSGIDGYINLVELRERMVNED